MQKQRYLRGTKFPYFDKEATKKNNSPNMKISYFNRTKT